MLIHFGVIPYIVFDGDYLPSKAATEVERAKKREESKRRGLELYRLNKPSQAHLELQKAVDVTPEMARQFIDELKKIGVQYVVAPYEADAQLAYLERAGIIQGMVSEDSDLLVFGAKRLLTKLDQYGDCVEISRSDFTACREISLVGWSDAEFRRMAILSGCDYLASINRMGLKSAYRFVRKYKTIEKILQMLAFDGQYYIPAGYLERFYKAELTFLHQRVFCPINNKVVLMTELEKGAHPEDFSFIGDDVEQDVAIGVANGDLDPMTKQPIRLKSATTTPKTPRGNPRRNTMNTFSDTKPNKSIESFFKSKRTPLAELDPNSFTPSPNQDRLLQRASGSSWDSSPAPAGPISLRSALIMPTQVPRSAQSGTVSQSLTDHSGTRPSQNPPKRRRLCIEPDDGQDTGNKESLEVHRSPFFKVNTSNPSPTITTSGKKKREKNVEISIWSDDSVEDVMAGLPDAREDSTLAKKGRLTMFEDDHHQEKSKPATWTQIRGNDEKGGDSQSSMDSRGANMSEMSQSTQGTSVTGSVPKVAQTIDKDANSEIKAVAATYAYRSETGDMAPQRKQVENKVRLHESEFMDEAPRRPCLLQQRSMTPLQRLRLGALNRSKSCNDVLSSEIKTSQDPEKQDLNLAIAPTTKHTLEIKRDFIPVSTFSATKGSEDAIIPDSEDSGDDVLSEAEGVTPKIDLGRFAFAG